MTAADRSQPTYEATKARLREYFDRTAFDAWARLTSDAPVSRVRETVRQGREAMRATLLSWLPEDLTGARLLDAGCGAGALAVAAAERGAEVVAIDVAPQIVAVAAERAPAELIRSGRLRFLSGDMLDRDLGRFDHAVAMDSLIHYAAADIRAALARLAPRIGGSILFTLAPRTPALTAMHLIGRAFPRGDRAPAIAPASPRALTRRLAVDPRFDAWSPGREARIARGFYVSHALELTRRDAGGQA